MNSKKCFLILFFSLPSSSILGSHDDNGHGQAEITEKRIQETLDQLRQEIRSSKILLENMRNHEKGSWVAPGLAFAAYLIGSRLLLRVPFHLASYEGLLLSDPSVVRFLFILTVLFSIKSGIDMGRAVVRALGLRGRGFFETNPPPLGPYQLFCAACSMNWSTLQCRCLDKGDGFQTTTLNTWQCSDLIHNCDGQLMCGECG